jgi:DNA-binding IclR family transcriptional regulator
MKKSPFTSIEKVLDILIGFSQEQEEFTADEISKRFNIPLSSTYKYLDILLKKGFLAKNDDTKKFGVGLILFKLGNLFHANLRLTEIAFPYMRSLSESSGETVILTVVHGWESMCIEKVESTNRIRFSVARGATLPLHAGASSKILLAYQENAFVSAFAKSAGLTELTKNTITDFDLLKKELKKIRKQGAAVSEGEADLVAIAIAAPIFDHRRTILSGISIVAPRERISQKKVPEIVDMVKDAAKKISYKIGYIEQ